MAADIAKLGFSVDTKGLEKGEKSLNKFSKTGEKTERKVGKLESKFKSFGKNASAAVSAVDGPLGGISSRISALTTVATAGGAAMTALAVGVTAATFAISKGVKELDELQVSLAKTEAIIKATGGAAGKTGEQLASQAQDIAFSTLASVEGISKAQGVLLTFKAISLDVFDDAIRLSQDMASVMGGDASTQALRLGKALNAPAAGMGALAIAGFKFTEQQKASAKAFEENGQILKAQSIILDEVKGQLEGVAENIAGKTLSGSLDTMGQAFDNFTVRIATNIGALETFKGFIDKLNVGIVGRTKELSPDSAAQAADKAMQLVWEIADAEEKAANMVGGIRKDAHLARVENLKKERQSYLDYASAVSQSENKILTARSDAVLASVKLAEENRKAALAAKAIEDAKPFEKWKKSIEEFQTPLQKLQAELTKINEGLSSGKLEAGSGVSAYLSDLKEKIDKINESSGDSSYLEWVDSIASETTIRKLQSLSDEITEVWLAMDAGDISESVGMQAIDTLEDKIKGLKTTVDKTDIFGGMTDSIGESLKAMQGFTDTGSKEYEKLGVAIQAVNAIQAIGAVINQGQGDPYSAFGRMAAMAASMAALGQSIGGLSSGFQDQSAANQGAQGLNVWGEKSESIANSIDITADATDRLVGINTGMLKALQAMQAGISGASGIAARGASGAGFGYSPDVTSNLAGSMLGKTTDFFANYLGDQNEFLSNAFNLMSGGFLTDKIGRMLGGSSSVVDSGIEILGGTLSDIIDGASVFAFRQTESKKYRWSSTKTHRELQLLDDASTQFTLVFSSLADAVFTGATSLGMAGSDVEEAINNFQIATTKISLKGLSLENQQKEIEAVFSQMFDNLSGAVVPFLADFQRTGEGLGETLSRLSVEVATADFAVKNLGINLGDKLADPQMYTQIADNLAMITGGIESFASKTASFIDTFAPDSVKFEMYSGALTEQLAAVGLAVPASADAFFALMQSLDGTTEAGRGQIAALLNSQEVASGYYDQLEELNGSLSSLAKSLRGTIESIYGISYTTSQITLEAALSSAKLGDFSKALELNLSNVAPSITDFSSMADYKFAQAATANKLEELASLADGTATVQDMTLTANQEQVALLTSINQNTASAYVPQQTQSQNNDTMVLELKAIREELELIKHADTATAKSTAKSANHLQNIDYDGVEVINA